MLGSANTAFLETVILSVISADDAYGYKIIRLIKETVNMSESAIYPVLRKMQTIGLLRSYYEVHNGRNRRYYSITDSGKQRLTDYREQWTEQRTAIDEIITPKIIS